jgi:hypothetical protein
MTSYKIKLVATDGEPLPDTTYRSDIRAHCQGMGIECIESFPFEPIEYFPDKVSVNRTSGRLFGGRGYSHSMYAFKKHTFTAQSFVFFPPGSVDIWRALQYRYIAVQTDGVWGDFIEVQDGGGDSADSLYEGITDIRMLSFELEEVETI